MNFENISIAKGASVGMALACLPYIYFSVYKATFQLKKLHCKS
jgi:hypothetical protein